eukprot:5374339-Pyramimonas_sp.AAC.1
MFLMIRSFSTTHDRGDVRRAGTAGGLPSRWRVRKTGRRCGMRLSRGPFGPSSSCRESSGWVAD